VLNTIHFSQLIHNLVNQKLFVAMHSGTNLSEIIRNAFWYRLIWNSAL